MALSSAYAVQGKSVRSTWYLVFTFTALVTGVCFVIGQMTNNYVWPFLGLAISLGQAAFAYFFGARLALSSVQAKQVDANTAPQLYNMVENLSKIAGIPTPKVYISPDPAPNAFATGKGPSDGHVVFNQGIIDLLDRNELEGVAAHELGHIKNRDILVMTMAMAMAGVIGFLVDMSMRTLRTNNRRDGDDSPIIAVFYFLIVFLAPLAAFLIRMAMSRSREYLADATAVTYTRFPQGLQSALTKLYNTKTPTKFYSSSRSHMYIAPPRKSFGQKISSLTSTHPPLMDRVTKLENMG